jgi:hypothetical protein
MESRPRRGKPLFPLLIRFIVAENEDISLPPEDVDVVVDFYTRRLSKNEQQETAAAEEEEDEAANALAVGGSGGVHYIMLLRLI